MQLPHLLLAALERRLAAREKCAPLCLRVGLGARVCVRVLVCLSAVCLVERKRETASERERERERERETIRQTELSCRATERQRVRERDRQTELSCRAKERHRVRKRQRERESCLVERVRDSE